MHAQSEYSTFGTLVQTIGGASNVRGYGVHYPDPESGLLYMGARYNDPVRARFTQPDVLVPEVEDPQSWNHYSFVRNNPFNRIDPTGREDLWSRLEASNFDLGATAGGALAEHYGGHEGAASFSGSLAASVVPGPGELADFGTLFSMDYRVGTGARLLAAGSLVLSVATGGFLDRAGRVQTEAGC